MLIFTHSISSGTKPFFIRLIRFYKFIRLVIFWSCQKLVTGTGLYNFPFSYLTAEFITVNTLIKGCLKERHIAELNKLHLTAEQKPPIRSMNK